MNSLIHGLRKNNIKAQVCHYRWAILKNPYINNSEELVHITQDNRKDYSIKSNGGKTFVRLTFLDGGEFSAEAFCSRLDTFDKREGVRIAVSRIMEQRKAEKIYKSLIGTKLTDSDDVFVENKELESKNQSLLITISNLNKRIEELEKEAMGNFAKQTS